MHAFSHADMFLMSAFIAVISSTATVTSTATATTIPGITVTTNIQVTSEPVAEVAREIIDQVIAVIPAVITTLS